MKRLRKISFMLILALVTLLLSGCSNTNKDEPDANAAQNTLNLVFCASYVDQALAEAYLNTLKQENDILNSGEMDVSLTVITTSGADPMMQMGGMMKLTAVIASNEVDLILCDEENAARNARSGSFYALNELLCEDEISALGDRALQYALIDDEGKPTDEFTAVCGMDVSADEQLKAVFNQADIGVFVAGNAPHLEAAKAVMKAIALK